MPGAGAYLLNVIHERTKKKCIHEITAKNYESMVKLWFETAEEMVKEFEIEGLYQTAEALKEEIKWQRKYCYH